MSTSSFITVKNALEQFAANHLAVKRYKTSFFEQIDNFSSSDNTFPILYVVPSDVTFDQYVDRFFFRIYVVDILQKDRSNESAILNDTLLTLRDLYNWLKIADNGLNVLSTARAIPVNNFLVDYTAGWYLDVEVEGLAESNDCSIPFSDNFTLTGYTCDFTYATSFLTCETLEECQAIIDINDRIDAIVVSADTFVVNGSYDNPSGTLTLVRNDGDVLNITGFTTGSTSGNDIYVTGGTFNAGTETLTLSRNDNQNVVITGFTSGGPGGFDVYVTGGTYSNGSAIFTNNTGGTFSVTGFVTGDTFVTGFAYDDANTFTIRQNNDQPDLNVTINTMSGLTVNGILSATTYLGLPIDITVTGGTYDNGTGIATFTNNTGGTFNVTGFSTGGGSTFTGGTVSGPTQFTNGLSANTFSATTYLGLPTDITITGGTFNGASIEFTNNTGGTFSVTGFTTTTGGIATWSQGADGTLVSGTSANSATYTQLISGGTMGNGSIIRVNYRIRTTINAATTIRFYVNTTPDLSGSPILCGQWNNNGATSFLVNSILRTLVVKNASNATEVYTTAGLVASDIGLYNGISTLNINWANDQYFVFAVQNPASLTQTARGSYYLIEKI
jgi:hypothetical protein